MRSTNRTGRKKTSGQKTSGIVKAFYIAAAVLMAICIYMIVVNSMYVVNYASSYGMTLSDMKLEAIQYIVTGSISYFVYGALLFAAGRIISMLQKAQSFGTCKASADESLYVSTDMQDTIGALSVEAEGASGNPEKAEDSGDLQVKDAGAESADDQEHVAGDLRAKADDDTVSGAADGAEETKKGKKPKDTDE